MLQQFRQRPLRTDVPGLDASQFLVRFHRGGDGHEAVEAARVAGPILVLGAAVHVARDSPKDGTMLDASELAERDLCHGI